MSKINDKVRIATADAAPRHKHPAIYSDHFTTQCFMRPSPVLCFEHIPKRTSKISHENFARFQPMPKAVFGRASVYNRCFFVPYRTVFRHFNDFVESSPSSVAIGGTTVLNNVPLISNNTLVGWLLSNFANLETGAGQGTGDYTIIDDLDGLSNGEYFLNDQGVFVHKVLRSLGYPLFGTQTNFESSVLPLLCFIKIHLDWYYPSGFAMDSVMAYFNELFENIAPTSSINLGYLTRFFENICYCSYNQDYFTSSWCNPVGPNSSNFEGTFNIPDITNNAATYRQSVTNSQSAASPGLAGAKPSNGTPFIGANSTSSSGSTNTAGVLTQYVIDALRSLTDYTVRHRLSGVRTLDRYLAEYGVNLGNEIAKRSIYLGYQVFPCQFGDNMSTSDTYSRTNNSGARLGDYSGKGIAYDRGTYVVDGFKEFGMVIVINSVVPHVGYYQGFDRHILHINPLDFYHGDFDHLGVQAISKAEVYGMCKQEPGSPILINNMINEVFGFVPRYGEYHVINDHVTGLPSLRSAKASYEGMLINRDLTSFLDQQGLEPPQSMEFVLGQDYQQYNRLFYNTDQSENIDMIHHFTVEHTDTCKDLFEVYDFEKHVNSVTMNINGTNLQ